MAADFNLTANRLANRNSQNKKQLHIDQWECNQRKRLRQSGQEYRTQMGEIHPAVEPVDEQLVCGPKCTRPGCLLEEGRCFELFDQYWSSASYNIQTGILLRLMRKTCVANRTVDIDTSRRTASYQYLLLNPQGIELQVCKSKFLRTFAISKSRIEVLQSKISSGDLYFSDNRGKHNNRPNRMSENVREAMTEHIDSYPIQLSHYQREKGDPGRSYLSPGLSIASMFNDFVAVYGEAEAESWGWAYRQIFKSKNLSIGIPKTDTCSKCDELKLKIDHIKKTGLEGNETLLFELCLEQTEHHLNAEDGFNAMREDKQTSINDNTYITLSIDMQGVLFSPVLSNSEYYYSRKFSTHNLAIVESANDFATMCLWHCTEGNKGSCEVTSSLLKYCQAKFHQLQVNQRRTLVIWTDRCAGQNNNKYVIMLLRYLITTGLFTTVHQKFLTTGHTFLPADRQFALIEKCKKGAKVYTPDDWIRLILEANIETPSVLQKMNLDDFKSMADLEQYFRIPNSLKVTQVKWIRMEKNNPNIIYTKEEIGSLDFTEHVVANQRSMENFVFNRSYRDFIPLAPAAVKDLKTLLRWVPQEYHTSWSFLNEYCDDENE